MAGNILRRGYLAGFGMTIGTVFGRIAGQEAAAHARGLTPTARARQMLTVCNACRYCEQFCPVFPAIERRTVVPGSPTCTIWPTSATTAASASTRASTRRRIPFGVNLPRALAEVRVESYRGYCWPPASCGGVRPPGWGGGPRARRRVHAPPAARRQPRRRACARVGRLLRGHPARRDGGAVRPGVSAGAGGARRLSGPGTGRRFEAGRCGRCRSVHGWRPSATP